MKNIFLEPTLNAFALCADYNLHGLIVLKTIFAPDEILWRTPF